MLDLHLWKLTEDKRLINKALGDTWKYGNVQWNIKKSKNSKFVEVVDSSTEKVLVPNEGKPLNKNLVDLEIKNKFQNQKWQFTKSTDINEAKSGWNKIKHIKSGFLLEVSESGEQLTIQGINFHINTSQVIMKPQS